MEPLIIKGTMKIPDVRFDAESGRLDISGRSIPENANEFYIGLMDWIQEYVKNPGEKTVVNVRPLYFNSRSLKALVDLFEELDKLFIAGKNVVVNWYYERDDDDMLEVGEDYKSELKMPFNLIGYGNPYIAR